MKRELDEEAVVCDFDPGGECGCRLRIKEQNPSHASRTEYLYSGGGLGAGSGEREALVKRNPGGEGHDCSDSNRGGDFDVDADEVELEEGDDSCC